MANVNNINDMAQSIGTGTTRDIKGSNKPSFENALSKAIDKNQNTGTKTGTSKGLEEIAAPGFTLVHSTEAITGQTGDLLDLLDIFSEKLHDPTASLKSIEPVLEELNRTADTLLEKTLELGSSDSALKKIATQTVVSARTEYIKFQRGDYLS